MDHPFLEGEKVGSRQPVITALNLLRCSYRMGREAGQRLLRIDAWPKEHQGTIKVKGFNVSTMNRMVGTVKMFALVAVAALFPSTNLAQTIAMTPGTISTLLGTGTAGEPANGSVAGTGTAVEPVYAIAIAPVISGLGGDIYFAESTSYVKVIYEGGTAAAAIIAANSAVTGTTSPTIGRIYTIAGTGSAGTGTDSGLSTSSKINGARGLAVDPTGNLFIADTGNNKVRIVYAGTVGSASALISLENSGTTPTAGYIYTVAGTGTAGTVGSLTGNGALASNLNLNSPRGLYVDSSDDVYIADEATYTDRLVYNGGSLAYTLLHIEGYTGPVSGTGTGYAFIIAGGTSANSKDPGDGGLGFNGAGSGTVTSGIYGAHGLGVNPTTGDVYVNGFNSYKVHKLTCSTGIITTIGGPGSATGGVAGNTGDGGLGSAATFGALRDMWVDAGGNVYLADASAASPITSAIRKIDQNGYVSTIAGTNGTASYTGDGGNATAATLDAPYDVKLDASGNLIIADEGNNRIRKVTVSAAVAGSVIGTALNNSGKFTYEGSFAFGSQTDGTQSTAPATALITNLTGSSVTPSLTIPYGFVQTLLSNSDVPDCSSSTPIPPGTSCTLALEFAPIASGSYSPTVTAVVGSDTVTIPVTGTGSYGATSTSTALSITPSGPPYHYGIPLTLQATVTPSTATGYVIFTDSVSGTLANVLLSSGSASYTASSLSEGAHTITATYTGNATYAQSTIQSSVPVSYYTSTTTISPSTTTPDLGAAVTLTTSVTGSSSPLPLPSGTVSLSDTLNSNNVVQLGGVTLSSGSGALTTSTLPFGSNLITGNYSGDTYNLSSNSSVTVTVSATRPAGIPGTISTIIGNGNAGTSTSPTGAATYLPTDVRIDASGNIYYTDYNDIVRVYNPGSTVVTIAGTSVPAGQIATIAGTASTVCPNPTGVPACGDGGLATLATLNTARGLALDAYGNVYISDTSDDRLRVVINSAPTGSPILGILTALGISPSVGYIYTLAGNGTTTVGTSGTLATSQGLSSRNLVLDSAGDIYLSDLANSRVRVIYAGGSTAASLIALETGTTPTGSDIGFMYTIAGTGSTTDSGDGAKASSAGVDAPCGVAFDANGNLLIVEYNGSAVRRVTMSTGFISLVAGTEGTSGYAGDGGAATSAQLNHPRDIYVDWAGNLYITDYSNNRIREVNNSTGVISTIAGYNSGTGDPLGDSGSATSAYIDGPNSAVFDLSGNLLIADNYNDRIRRVSATSVSLTFPTTVVNANSNLTAVITNNGNQTINSISVGSVPTAYALTPSGGTDCTSISSLSSGQSCNVEVVFTPTAASSYTGTITVSNSKTPITINISGYGSAASPITLSSTSTNIVAGGSIALTATVTGNSPTGVVNFYYTLLGSSQQILFAVGTLSSGTVTTSSIALPSTPTVGVYNFTAVYYGDTHNGPSTSAITAVSVGLYTITTGSSGYKQFTINGQPFIPKGVNYLEDWGYGSMNMFDSRSSYYNQSTLNQNLSWIAQNGFTYVRLWLKGYDTLTGFQGTGSSAAPSCAPNAQWTTANNTAWNAYVSHIVTTIQYAQSVGLAVVLTGSFPGGTTDPFTPLNCPVTQLSTTGGMNDLLLNPAETTALGTFYSALLQSMVAQDSTIASGILYFDIYNELHYDLTSLPLVNDASGDYFTYPANSIQYNLNNFNASGQYYPQSRQALMDTAAQNFIQTVGSSVQSVVPVMVTASSYYNYAFNHTAFDGGNLESGENPNNYALRPYYELQGGANLIDLHTYPSPSFTSEPVMLSNEVVESGATGTQVDAATTALIAGEFGTNNSSYPSGINSAVAEMQLVVTDDFKPYNFTGYAIWDWNLDVSLTSVLIDSSTDPSCVYMTNFAPNYQSSLCTTEQAQEQTTK
jgi:hypothetical protein